MLSRRAVEVPPGSSQRARYCCRGRARAPRHDPTEGLLILAADERPAGSCFGGGGEGEEEAEEAEERTGRLIS